MRGPQPLRSQGSNSWSGIEYGGHAHPLLTLQRSQFVVQPLS